MGYINEKEARLYHEASPQRPTTALTLSDAERVFFLPVNRCKYNAFTLSAWSRVRLTMLFVVSLG